jgi:hypothetical protein
MVMMTPAQETELAAIREKAKVRHELARKAAKKRGRKDFPLLPYECSWAYEEEFKRKNHVSMR